MNPNLLGVFTHRVAVFKQKMQLVVSSFLTSLVKWYTMQSIERPGQGKPLKMELENADKGIERKSSLHSGLMKGWAPPMAKAAANPTAIYLILG